MNEWVKPRRVIYLTIANNDDEPYKVVFLEKLVKVYDPKMETVLEGTLITY